MTNDIKWFIEILSEEKLMSVEECYSILKEMQQGVTLEDFAQEAFNYKSEGMDEAHAKILLEKFENALDYAASQASKGIEAPEIEEETVPEESEEEEEEEVTPSEEPVESDQELDFSNISSMDERQLKKFLSDILTQLKSEEASDLHLSAGARPFVRHALEVQILSDYVLTADDSYLLNTAYLTEEQSKSFKEKKDFTYPLALESGDRYRATLMYQKDGVSATYHIVSNKVSSLKNLGFSENNTETITKLLDYHNGLVLVTGPVGAGKTTTLASLIDIVNAKRKDHIIAVEDPIEIVQTSLNCNVTQRQVETHTQSYKRAINGALREDPDVVIIGELKDLETTEIAITASETGHLVIATLPTCDAINTLNRIVNVFPPQQQAQIRTMVAGSLRGILCQKLLPRADEGVAVGCEILINTSAVANKIMDGQYHLLKPIIQTGVKAGMTTMDESIYSLYKEGVISSDVALDNFENRKQYERFLKGKSL